MRNERGSTTMTRTPAHGSLPQNGGEIGLLARAAQLRHWVAPGRTHSLALPRNHEYSSIEPMENGKFQRYVSHGCKAYLNGRIRRTFPRNRTRSYCQACRRPASVKLRQ